MVKSKKFFDSNLFSIHIYFLLIYRRNKIADQSKGKTRDFDSRFNGSNPLSAAKGEVNMDTKICTKCGRDLPLTSYYSRGGGKLRSECKDCHNNYVKGKYQERKDWTNEIKQSIGCQKCGEKRPYLLDFHHKDPSIKDADIARLTSNRNKKEDIQKEIDKCVVLCANCHREFHHLERYENMTIKQYLE